MSLFSNLSNLPPLVIRLHGEEYTALTHTPGAAVPLAEHLSRHIQRLALRRAVALISPSRLHAQSIASEIKRSINDITVISNTLNPKWLVWQSQARGTPREPIILFVGRLQFGKGIFDALRCFALIHEKVPETRLVIIGAYHPTISPETIRALIDELHLSESIDLLGPLPQEQLVAWYARACVFLMPSYYETFGLVALEAMTLGLPIVAYRAGALPEITENGKVGLLANVGAIPALAENVVALLGDKPRWEALSRGASQKAATYKLDQNVEATLNVYHDVLRT